MQLLAGIGPIGPVELVVILVIVILIFGVGRLPEVGGAVGKGIREFRKATKDDEAEAAAATLNSAATPETVAPVAPAPAPAPTPMQTAAPSAAPSATADTMFCSECGARNLRTAKFCAECGRSIGASVS
jgi:sec-independent protein translocase protein TatA